jgi:pimeloyl-ACP methyl ester carboxylesterase
MCRALLAFLLLLPLHAAHGEPLWQTLPPTPVPVPGEHTGHAKVNGITLYYATIGHGSPVVLLHGGLSNSDYWGNQIKALAPRHTVIVMDSRGHGRSTRDARPYGYDLMADDVVALLDTLQIAKAVGWSDGAYQGFGLDIPARNGAPGEWALPVSATYVIDRDGSIIYAYTDVDYRDRADPRDVLKVLTQKAAAA